MNGSGKRDSQASAFYKAKYKFIDFKRPDLKSNNEELKSLDTGFTDDIKTFYDELVKTDSSQVIVEGEKVDHMDAIKNERITPNRRVIIKPKEYLNAAHHSKLDVVKDFLEKSPELLNEKDQYGWNAIMIAVAAKNNEIVRYLVENHVHNDLFNKFISAKDSAGNDVYSIAKKSRNNEAIKIINEYKIGAKKPALVLNREELDKSETILNKYCSVCKLDYSGMDHLSSISHLFNVNRSEDGEREMPYNYHLRSNNKGYQLLCKSGWENKRGLGKSEQGTIFPVKASNKYDRKGIGETSSTDHESQSKYVFDKKILKIERPKLPKTSVQAGSSTRIESQLKHMKYSLKKRQKEKNLERNLRSYFSK